MALTHRIVAVSDAHINYSSSNETVVSDAASLISDLHNERTVDVVLYVGDTSQDSAAHDEIQTHFLNNLPSDVPYRFAYGNHEYIDPPEWPDQYGHDVDDASVFGQVGVLTVQSAEAASDGHNYTTAGACPDLTFVQNTLDDWETDSSVESVFINCHVRPWDEDWASHGAGNDNCTDVRDEFERDIVDGVFTGHSHTENEVINTNDEFGHDPGQDYIFTPHLGDRDDGGREQVRVLDVYDDRYEHRALDVSDGSEYESTTITHSREYVTSVDVTAGNRLVVEADVTNTADGEGDQDIILERDDGTVVDTEGSVQLNTDETTSTTLEWITQSGDEGDYTMTVKSDDDSDSIDVSVQS